MTIGEICTATDKTKKAAGSKEETDEKSPIPSYAEIRGLIHKSWQLFFFSRKCANTGNLIYTFESV
jgi:hypothetical protein